MVGKWELGGPETGGAQPGLLIPLCPELTSCLQMSQHIFLMSSIKFSPVPPTLGIFSGQKDDGITCQAGARHRQVQEEPSGGIPSGQYAVGRNARGVGGGTLHGELARRAGVSAQTLGFTGEDCRKGQVHSAWDKLHQSKIIFLIVVIIGISNMNSVSIRISI